MIRLGIVNIIDTLQRRWYEVTNQEVAFQAIGNIVFPSARVCHRCHEEEIFEKILAVASGEQSKSELLGVGEEEFAPWQIGVLS